MSFDRIYNYLKQILTSTTNTFSPCTIIETNIDLQKKDKSQIHSLDLNSFGRNISKASYPGQYKIRINILVG